MKRPFVEYDLYLPIPGDKEQRQILKLVKRRLIDFFGGLTVTNYACEGEWRFGAVHIHDKIQIWRILSDRGTRGDTHMRKLKESLQDELDQEEILIVKRAVDQL